MKTFIFFASTYPSVETMEAATFGDNALKLHRKTEQVQIQAESLETATTKFQHSEVFDQFCSEHVGVVVYTYRVNDSGKAVSA